MDIKTPASRLSDPVTSYLAEEGHNKGKRFTHQQTVYAFVKRAKGRTAAELGFLSGLGQHETSRRLADLTGIYVRKGEIRKCTVNGTSMVTWYPIPPKDGLEMK